MKFLIEDYSKYDDPAKLLKVCGKYVYHITEKRHLKNILENGLTYFWFGYDPVLCGELVYHNHPDYKDFVIIEIKTDELEPSLCSFIDDAGDGVTDDWGGTAIYEGTITKFSNIYWDATNDEISDEELDAITPNRKIIFESKLNEDLWQHRNGQEIYNPMQDFKYKKLQKKPINTLTIDEIKYLFIINRSHYGMYSRQYDNFKDAYTNMIDDDRENSYDTEMFEDCYNHFSKLKFPLTIYRAIRVDEIDSDGNLHLGNNSRSWTTTIDLYKKDNSTFKNLTTIVSATINSDIIDNSATIVNYYYYTASRTVGYNKKNNIFGEFEISLKSNFNSKDLKNLHIVNKNSINEDLYAPDKYKRYKLNDKFFKWFDGSKVVTLYGDPLIVYHGTMHSFDKFIPNKASEDFPPAMYFTTNKNIAKSYGNNVNGYFIRLTDPYYGDARGKTFNDYYDEFVKVCQQAYNDGKDGVIVRRLKDDWAQKGSKSEGTTFVVFNSNDIKSVNNRGIWSETDNINEDVHDNTDRLNNLHFIDKNIIAESVHKSLQDIIIDKLISLGYEYTYRHNGWIDKNEEPLDQKEFEVDESGETIIPEGAWWFEDDGHMFRNKAHNIEFSFNIDENNKVFKILTIWSYDDAPKGDATKALINCLSLIPDGWTIQIDNDLNRGYWMHIRDKFPQFNWGGTAIYEDLKDKAKDYFGTTSNWKLGFYINTDGTILDGSGMRLGNIHANKRAIDHRDIADIYPDGIDGFDAMLNYIKEGNIRFMPETQGFEMLLEPTEAQYKTMTDLIYKFDGNNGVDLIDEYGNIKDTLDYNDATLKLIDDVRYYFKTGKIPYKSSLSKFTEDLDLNQLRTDRLKTFIQDHKNELTQTNPNVSALYYDAWLNCGYMGSDELVLLTNLISKYVTLKPFDVTQIMTDFKETIEQPKIDTYFMQTDVFSVDNRKKVYVYFAIAMHKADLSFYKDDIEEHVLKDPLHKFITCETSILSTSTNYAEIKIEIQVNPLYYDISTVKE